MASAGDLAVVLDPLGGDTREQSWALLKPGGQLLSIVGAPDPQKAAEHGVRAAGVFVHPSGAQLAEIAALIAAGKVRPHVSRVYPLAGAARAHQEIETGHVRGKLVLQIAS